MTAQNINYFQISGEVAAIGIKIIRQIMKCNKAHGKRINSLMVLFMPIFSFVAYLRLLSES